MAKAWAQTGEAPDKVIAALSAAIDPGTEDDADALRAYGLLAEAYLKLPTPDVEKALAATDQQIRRPIMEDRLLGPVRLRRGELLVRLNRLDEAVEGYRWYRRLAGDARKRNPILAAIYKGG